MTNSSNSVKTVASVIIPESISDSSSDDACVDESTSTTTSSTTVLTGSPLNNTLCHVIDYNQEPDTVEDSLVSVSVIDITMIHEEVHAFLQKNTVSIIRQSIDHVHKAPTQQTSSPKKLKVAQTSITQPIP
ncbi:hypothetical protein Pelo_8914 [Pelomyxa schiedti]|nr:hypothetical protein Pelo_8914 [Pelomyxa schiedti]